MNNYYISFGTNCAPSFHIKKIQKSPTYFFDNIRSSIDAINLVIDNMLINNNSFLDNLRYVNNLIKHPDVFLIFPHDKDVDVAINTYKRRFDRMLNTMRDTDQNIVLLCYIEENQKIPDYNIIANLILKINRLNDKITLSIIADQQKMKNFDNNYLNQNITNVNYIGLTSISNTFEWTRSCLDWSEVFYE